jgi:hypothetical protein
MFAVTLTVGRNLQSWPTTIPGQLSSYPATKMNTAVIAPSQIGRLTIRRLP